MTNSSKKRIALISPSASVRTETFIKAHKDYLNGEIYHYHTGFLPKKLDGHGALMTYDIKSRLLRKMAKSSPFEPDEQVFFQSLKDNEIQVVFAEYGPTGAHVTRACKAAGIPLVVHFHGYDASQYDKLEKYAQPYKDMFEYASQVIVPSKKMKSMLLECGAIESRITRTPYGPDPLFLEMARIENSETKFLFAGRFVDKKAPYYLLLAFKELLAKGVEAKLTMAGDGALWPAVKNMVEYFGMSEQVMLTGSCDHATIVKLMQEATCYVQHSIRAESGDMEGAPVAIIEAAASGLPVVSTRHAGIPDVILEEETGYLVDEHDVSAMAEAMEKIAKDPKAAFEMGQASRERVKENFTREMNIATINKVIQEAALK